MLVLEREAMVVRSICHRKVRKIRADRWTYGSVSQIPARPSCGAGLSDEWKLHEGGDSESKVFAYRKDWKVVLFKLRSQ
jgi:hypothetical protein